MKGVHATRKFDGKKCGALKTTYPPKESFDPEFIKDVEFSRQEVLRGKGVKFNTVEDFLNNLEISNSSYSVKVSQEIKE